MKLTDEDKKDLVQYLDGAISYLDKELKPLRDKVKRLMMEKNKLQKIRKAIK